MMSRPCIEVAMEVEEEKLFLLVVESSPGDIQQRSYDQRGKPRPIIGGLRYGYLMEKPNSYMIQMIL